MAKVDTKQGVHTNQAWAQSVLPRRSPGAHKWGVGGLLVIGGAPGYIGAPAMASLAAMRIGAGIVIAAVARASIAPIASVVPEVVFLPMPEGDSQSAARESLKLLEQKADRVNALVVGPGLSEDDYASALMSCLFAGDGGQPSSSFGFGSTGVAGDTRDTEDHLVGGSKTTVVDADGLNWLSKTEMWWDRVRPGSLVLTPHLGEMSRLTGADVGDLEKDPIAAAREWASTWGQIVLLKSNPAVVTDGNTVIVQDDITPGFATAGTGDVLAGAVGGFLAQGMQPLEAGGLALYLGSAAAEALTATVGVLGMVASDLPKAMAAQIALLESE